MEQSPLIFGLILQSSMIMALGAQNLFVLEKGLHRDRALMVAGICSFCDVSLIFLGVMGAGSFFAENASFSLAMKILGALFLFKYAYGKFREAGHTVESQKKPILQETGIKALIYSSLAVSLLNPHVYLDTVILIGGYSTKFAETQDKLNFALGAAIFSVIWFFSVSMGAGLLSNVLKKPKAMRMVNYGSSAIMAYLGINLLWTI